MPGKQKLSTGSAGSAVSMSWSPGHGEGKASKRSPLSKFRAYIRLVLANIHWLKEGEDPKPQVALKYNVKVIVRKTAEKQVVRPDERAILLKPRAERTPENLQVLYDLVGRLHGLDQYPQNVQRSLAEVTYFASYSPNRVIIKEGHPAFAMYFVVGGELNDGVTQVDPITGETSQVIVGTIDEGQIFGELALLLGIPRTSTVTTKTNCELLCLGKHDFDCILKATLEKDWDRMKTTLGLFPYFNDWSAMAVRECCMKGVLKTFEKDDVILSKTLGSSDFVHFVVDGLCVVIHEMLIDQHVNRYGETIFRLVGVKEATQQKDTALKRYMQACFFSRGETFCIGENLDDRYILAATDVECLLIPRMLVYQHAKNNMWGNVKNFLEKRIPSKEIIFKEFLKANKWERFKSLMIKNIVNQKNIPTNTSIYDVPYSLRIHNPKM